MADCGTPGRRSDSSVTGYFPAGTGYTPLANPARILETRNGPTVDGKFRGIQALNNGSTVKLQVSGRAGIPTNAAAVVLNITAVNPRGPGHATVHPCHQSRPNASNLNYAAGDVVANMVVATPDPTGKVCIYTHATSDLIADVAGYFKPGRFYESLPKPARILDTRNGSSGAGSGGSSTTVPGSNGGHGGHGPGGTPTTVPGSNGGHGGHGGHGGPSASGSSTTLPGGGSTGNPWDIPAFTEADYLPRRPGRSNLRVQDCAATWSHRTDKYPGCTPRDSADGPFNGIGTFRVFCDYTHMAYDDPIIFPGQVNASHLHLFFGNTTTDENSNLDDMRLRGNSTCDGGIADRSAYWVPALYDPTRGEIIEPWIFATYYQSGFGGLDPATIQPIPEGLRMIIGKASATPATYSQYNTGFGLGGRWGCFRGGGGPTDTGGDIPDCGSDRVTLVLNFPRCWDGKNLDSADHISHMAQVTVRFSGGTCTGHAPGGDPVDHAPDRV